ncbi:hypothetical protein EW093_16295 [Thiospirochaeta perfilievii]|uniref:Rubrerythrin diiron-binding domain-containing protein n=1 Tax=Thiospirochaeta perfilievii TaxID=252967 RepID=A0A5C1QGH8_9SPIO|nr:ferritin family protein [Thiospirochaeta perfilievii]QEN06180.1 hypothetical protein EW093_16295 [Thiospirochaeta perfilievii]
MKYSLSEIMDIASGIEKSGYDFYIKAAKKINKFSDFFNFLAKEEIAHDSVFKGLKKEFVSTDELNTVYDPDNIISKYIESLTDSIIFKSDEDLDSLLSSSDSIEDIIDWSIQREHDTILFYVGLKSSLSSESDKIIVEKIISEEMNHVHILMNKKSELLIK